MFIYLSRRIYVCATDVPGIFTSTLTSLPLCSSGGTRSRNQKWVAISTVSDPSGSGRVDMLTGPVAAARAVVATGAWVESKHDMYLIRANIFAHPPEDKKKKI